MLTFPVLLCMNLPIIMTAIAKYTVINEYWTMELMAYMLECLLVLDHASIDHFMQTPMMGKIAKKYKELFIYLHKVTMINYNEI